MQNYATVFRHIGAKVKWVSKVIPRIWGMRQREINSAPMLTPRSMEYWWVTCDFGLEMVRPLSTNQLLTWSACRERAAEALGTSGEDFDSGEVIRIGDLKIGGVWVVWYEGVKKAGGNYRALRDPSVGAVITRACSEVRATGKTTLR